MRALPPRLAPSRLPLLGLPLLGLPLLGLLLAGCTGEAPQPDVRDAAAGTARPSASPAPTAVGAGLLADAGQQAVLATADGPLSVDGQPVTVRVEVLAVRAGAEATTLRWRLSSPTPDRVRVYTSALSAPLLFDTRQVALRTAEQELRPFTYVPQVTVGGQDAGCACSLLPAEVGPDGEAMSALLPPLPPGTSTVDVVLPGVVELVDVPVTR